MDGKETWLRMAAVGAVAFAAGVGSSYVANNYLKSKPIYHKVGKISNIVIHPIKSCRGLSVDEAYCTRLGPQNGEARDRTFLITDADYHFLTARTENQMVLIEPTIKNGYLTLDAPGMETFELRIPKETQVEGQKCKIWGQKSSGVDCGAAVGYWIERFLERADNSTRLLYHPWDTSIRYYPYWNKWELHSKNDQPIYDDSSAYMMLGEGSLNDLNNRTNDEFTHRSFRPNFTVEGTHPYEEDYWKYLKIGNETAFRCIRPCTRCIFTTIDPETGIKGVEPLKTLRTYRRPPDPTVRKREGDSPMFGKHLGLDSPGVVRVGDEVYASF